MTPPKNRCRVGTKRNRARNGITQVRTCMRRIIMQHASYGRFSNPQIKGYATLRVNACFTMLQRGKNNESTSDNRGHRELTINGPKIRRRLPTVRIDHPFPGTSGDIRATAMFLVPFSLNVKNVFTMPIKMAVPASSLQSPAVLCGPGEEHGESLGDRHICHQFPGQSRVSQFTLNLSTWLWQRRPGNLPMKLRQSVAWMRFSNMIGNSSRRYFKRSLGRMSEY